MATYMGFRTYRYCPETTSCVGGATGAGVPNPLSAKRAKDSSRLARPSPTSKAPKARPMGRPRNGLSTRHPVRANGIRPATDPGASTKNSTEPGMTHCALGSLTAPLRRPPCAQFATTNGRSANEGTPTPTTRLDPVPWRGVACAQDIPPAAPEPAERMTMGHGYGPVNTRPPSSVLPDREGCPLPGESGWPLTTARRWTT